MNHIHKIFEIFIFYCIFIFGVFLYNIIIFSFKKLLKLTIEEENFIKLDIFTSTSHQPSQRKKESIFQNQKINQ